MGNGLILIYRPHSLFGYVRLWICGKTHNLLKKDHLRHLDTKNGQGKRFYPSRCPDTAWQAPAFFFAGGNSCIN